MIKQVSYIKPSKGTLSKAHNGGTSIIVRKPCSALNSHLNTSGKDVCHSENLYSLKRSYNRYEQIKFRFANISSKSGYTT